MSTSYVTAVLILLSSQIVETVCKTLTYINNSYFCEKKSKFGSVDEGIHRTGLHQLGLREGITPLYSVLPVSGTEPEWVQWRGTPNRDGQELENAHCEEGLSDRDWHTLERRELLWAAVGVLRDTCYSLWGHYQGYWGRLCIEVLRGKTREN